MVNEIKNSLSFSHKFGIEISPNEADFAIVSTDEYGTPGLLNTYVLKEYGYPEDSLSKIGKIRDGFTSTLSESQNKSIIFVVTVNERKTELNLRENLYKALEEFHNWLSNKKVWIPLMGTGTGSLSLDKSLSITIETINKFEKKFNSNGTFLISLPNNDEGNILFQSINSNDQEKLEYNIDSAFKSYKGDFFLASAWHENRNKVSHFYNNNLWETKFNEKIASIVRSAKPGDIVFLNRSQIRQGMITPYVITGIGKVLYNPNNGNELTIDWKIRNLQTNIRGYGNYNQTFDQIEPRDIEIFLGGVKKEEIQNSGLLENNGELVITATVSLRKKSRIANLVADNESGDDYLGINQDVIAFAKIMSAKSFTPPLAIALFGQWGSGKSFFMNKLKDQINILSAKDERTYCQGIAHVHFNAWSYLDANLWAGLVSKIFEGLYEYISNDSQANKEKDRIKQELSNQLNITQEEVQLLEKQKKAIEEQINDLDDQRKRLTESIENDINSIERKSLKDIIETIDSEFNLTEEIANALKGNETYKKTEAELKEIIPEKYWENPTELYNQVRSSQTYLKEFFKRDKIGCNLVGLCLILIIILVTPTIINIFSEVLKNADFTIPQVGLSALIVIGSVWKRAETIYTKLKPIIGEFWKIKTDYEKQIEEAIFKHGQEEKALKLKIDQGKAELQVINEKTQHAKAVKTDLEYRINNALASEALYSFIEKRSNSDDYKKYLGIVSIIRKDFEILSSLFLEHNNENTVAYKFRQKFDKPLERIILYIDDLDRCPEDRVVEVLEAVNLLMAFPLFIVVVGVDPRWVKNALIKKYQLQFAGQLNRNRASRKIEIIAASNYLEKIFQIPFHLKDATDNSVKHMLKTLSGSNREVHITSSETQSQGSSESKNTRSAAKGITSNNDNNTHDSNNLEDPAMSMVLEEKTEYLVLTEKEISLIQDLSEIIGNNPRAIKRFVNVYQIVRTHEGLAIEKEFEDQEYLVLMFLLALSIGPFKNFIKSFKEFISLAGNQEGFLWQFMFEDKDIKNWNPQLNRLNSIMHEYNSLSKLLDEPISSFYNHNRFIQRFTFDENI